MSSRKTIPTRFLVISDTHSTPPLPSDKWDSPYRLPFPKADVILHCGDISDVGNTHEYEPILWALKVADAELKIVIAGNHDITLDEDCIKRKVGWNADDRAMVERAKEMWSGPDARAHGIVYLEEGVHEFTLKSGAVFTIYASPYTPGLDWAFPYPRHENRFNPSLLLGSTTISQQHTTCRPSQAKNPIPSYPAIDIMLTHGPPEGILDCVSNGTSVGCEHLRRALERAKPKMHCFGHIHECWGAEIWNWSKGRESSRKVGVSERGELSKTRRAYVDGRTLKHGKETLCMNAAIVDDNNIPTNAPWIVDLELGLQKNVDGEERGGSKRKWSEERKGIEVPVTANEKEDPGRMRPKKEEVENPEIVPILSYP